MPGFFHRLHQALVRGPVALATVTAAAGSTPRVAGARQFMAGNGESGGTIGGGAVEARGMELATKTLADGQPRTFNADLRGRPGNIRDGVCGGTMVIWIVRLDSAADLHVVRETDAALRTGQRVTLATHLRDKFSLTLGPTETSGFIETLEPAPRLFIAGAGHIGRALALLATNLDFSVIVQDERPAWLMPSAFPVDCELHGSLAAAVRSLNHWQGERLAALVTRGLPQDVEALDALAAVPGLAYLGLLGSRARVATVLQTQQESGAAGLPADIFHAPIGIEIGAETPAEIAVSIAAEIIQVRRRPRESAIRSANAGLPDPAETTSSAG